MIDLTRYAASLHGKPVAVLGLGLSGMATVRALAAAGAHVLAWDDDEQKRAIIQGTGAVLDNLADLSGVTALVLAPGIPLHFPKPHPAVLRARAAGVEILGDIEIFHRARPERKTIGITGTNGKSTTTALVGHILSACGVSVAVGGNIGLPVLALAEADITVLELSSYQLDLCPDFAPVIAAHINLTPDHIDRHGTLENYISAKMRIFRGPGQAVIGIDDAQSRAMMARVAEAGERTIHPVTINGTLEHGVDVAEGTLFDALSGPPFPAGDLGAMPSLPGAHNHQNAAIAYAICRLAGLESPAIMAAMKTFPGLAHRLFRVRVIAGIPYVNDSKATNAAATAKALASYNHIHWILGGVPKAGGLAGLEPFMDKIAHAYTIGQAAEDFAQWLAARHVPVMKCGTLDAAIANAHKNTQEKGVGVVLLSPACASFDQFRSFEQRGQVFTDIVKGL